MQQPEEVAAEKDWEIINRGDWRTRKHKQRDRAAAEEEKRQAEKRAQAEAKAAQAARETMARTAEAVRRLEASRHSLKRHQTAPPLSGGSAAHAVDAYETRAAVTGAGGGERKRGYPSRAADELHAGFIDMEEEEEEEEEDGNEVAVHVDFAREPTSHLQAWADSLKLFSSDDDADDDERKA